MITVICAWCGAYLGFKIPGNGTSHGICDACYKKVTSATT